MISRVASKVRGTKLLSSTDLDMLDSNSVDIAKSRITAELIEEIEQYVRSNCPGYKASPTKVEWESDNISLDRLCKVEATLEAIEDPDVKAAVPWGGTKTSFDNVQLPTDAKKVYVLVDGDITAYKVSAAADGRVYTVPSGLNGEAAEFKYKTDASAYAEKKSLYKSLIKVDYRPEPWDAVAKSIDAAVANIVDYFVTEKKENPVVKICLSCKRNFRYDLYEGYKRSRQDMRRPHHLDACKQYLIDKHGAHMFDPFEADDLIAMLTAEILANTDEEVFIVSNDKDFTQLGCDRVTFFDPSSGRVWKVTEEEALRYFYKQILTGDKSDDIPGIVGIGPEKAIKILERPFHPESALNKAPIEVQLMAKVVRAYTLSDKEGREKKHKISEIMQRALDNVRVRGAMLRLTRTEDEADITKGVWSGPDLMGFSVKDFDIQPEEGFGWE